MTGYDSVPTAGARLSINLDAIVRNYRRIVAMAPRRIVAGVVKANAYGLGASAVSSALAAGGCSHFFVAQVSEVAAVRAVVPPDAVIYVLNGLPAGAEGACIAGRAIPVLNSLEQIAAWRAAAGARRTRLAAVLQVDSGMARLGLTADAVDQVVARPELLDGIDLRFVMSHLACADETDSPANERQRARFEAICARLPALPRSLANSGGAFLGTQFHFDLLRPGIALYGGTPRPDVTMEPVVSLTADIIQIRTVPAGAGLGYGLTTPAPTDRIVATIGVGYADGWPRRLGNRGSVFLAGVRAPIVGRVSMDSSLIDVTAIPEAARRPGAPVELLGPHQTVDDVAADAETISYEILTQLGARYARRYLGAQTSETLRSAVA